MNARNLKTVTSNVNKVRDFSALLELCQSDIVAVTETWLNSNITDGELFSYDYVTYRKDREATVQNKRGGCILLSIKGNIPSRRRPDLEAECEILVCEAQLVNVKKNAFILCYRPPSFNRDIFYNVLDDTLQRDHKEYENVCALGDFNFPEIP